LSLFDLVTSTEII